MFNSYQRTKFLTIPNRKHFSMPNVTQVLKFVFVEGNTCTIQGNECNFQTD